MLSSTRNAPQKHRPWGRHSRPRLSRGRVSHTQTRTNSTMTLPAGENHPAAGMGMTLQEGWLLRAGWRAITTLCTPPVGLFSPAQIEVSMAENQHYFKKMPFFLFCCTRLKPPASGKVENTFLYFFLLFLLFFYFFYFFTKK